MKRNSSEASFEVIINNKSIFFNLNHEQDKESQYHCNYFDFQPIDKPYDERSSSVKKKSSRILLNKEGVKDKGEADIGKKPPCKKANCELVIGKWSYPCEAKLSPYHLTLKLDKSIEKYFPYDSDYYKITLNAVAEVNKAQFNQYQWALDVLTKDYRRFALRVSSLDHSFVNSLIECSFYRDIDYYDYAKWFFKHHSDYQLKKTLKQSRLNNINGWDIYSIEEEFLRQGVDFNKKDSKYRLMSNANYGYCRTYPKQVVIPSNMRDKDIKDCSRFRTKERFPALTYRHKNNRCIWRSSQSKGGLRSQKNEQDVVLLTSITDSSKKLMLYDARPYLNAFANQIQGNGFENIYNYPKIKMEILFCYISNIHVIRSSLNKLFAALQSESDSKYLTAIDNSLWYDYITLILKTSFDISKSIKNDCTVLIHCSDGWDRTTQLCSTSQLLLDPYYRTLIGFIVLIEKDWLSFGHQFALRNGNSFKGEDQCAPIFLQWLDAVYQLLQQNVFLFEYNSDLLVFLASELYNGKYGTFLFNSDKERAEHKAKDTTVSIWTYVMDNQHLFLNPFFNREENLFCDELRFEPKKVRLWEEFMFKHEGKSMIKPMIERIGEKDKEIDTYKAALAEIYKAIKGRKEMKKELSEETVNVLEKFKEISEMSSYVVIENKKSVNKGMTLKPASSKIAPALSIKAPVIEPSVKLQKGLEIIDSYL